MKQICCNCKHKGHQFKIVNMTHLHCGHPDVEIRNPMDKEDTGWDSLREIWDTCASFEANNPCRPESETSPGDN